MGEELRRRVPSGKAPFYAAGAVRLSISLLPVNNGNNLKGEINKQSKQHVMLMNKGKQTNKQTKNRGMDTRGSTMSHSLQSLLHSTSEEMFGGAWSLVHKVVL